MSDQLLLAFELATEHAKQLITISTGVLAISISFLMQERRALRRKGWLIATWIAHAVSTIAGVFAMSALTGQLAPMRPTEEVVTGIASSARFWAALQVVSFLFGTITITVFGFRILPRELTRGPAEPNVGERIPGS